ncbi:hypothetical protein VHEMI02627 [[Torrubiella] hemipterigena]|uniref:Carboxylic ester hydrolase n=1 Tax=[Torrubiella] hemipterigena TaxID=1531966 RepID=A0A0A1SQ55_9HYPO|nr:hypothetical protein VHEMI02627 [[Torrubiella] hemipterigena]
MCRVQKYIRLFGGDPENVTIFGESAGGGSIMHHLTANGGKGNVPFKRAIGQSPGYTLSIQDKEILHRLFATASEIPGKPVATVEELNNLDTDELIAANAMTIFPSCHGTYRFGPESGGSYTPKLPGQLLLEGRYHQDVDVMVAHNAHEAGGVFPKVNSEDDVRKVIIDNLASISAKGVDSVLQLYPAPPYGQLYTTQETRAETIFSEILFQCNSRYVGKAYYNCWNYRFQAEQGHHGQDIKWTVLDGHTSNVTAPQLAELMQDYFLQFATTSNPNDQASG